MMFLKAVSAARRTYPVVTNGLKLYLDAYNIRSYPGTGTTWYDLSNSGYNLTNNGGTWTVSGGRRYFELDGVNDYIEGATNTSLFDNNTVGWTRSIWLYYVTSPAWLDGVIMAKLTSAIPYYLDNRNSMSTGNGNGWRVGITGANDRGALFAQTISTGVWIHAVGSFTYITSTTGTFKIYIDGVEKVSTSQTLPSGTWADYNNAAVPTIGALNINGTLARFNNIRVGEVLFYQRPLTGTEVSNNYNATKSNYGL
jgi:hypothetical protein